MDVGTPNGHETLAEAPYMERLVLGAVAGAFAGLLSGPIASYMEGAVIIGVLMAALLSVVGASCGVISKYYGWAAVRPLAWAILGGVIMHVDRPLGWLIGGAVGGALNGLLRRSAGRAAFWLWVGAMVGVVAWAGVYGYLLAFISVLNCG
jgi:hypothetical protein